jgi:hypothetical protein
MTRVAIRYGLCPTIDPKQIVLLGAQPTELLYNGQVEPIFFPIYLTRSKCRSENASKNPCLKKSDAGLKA